MALASMVEVAVHSNVNTANIAAAHGFPHLRISGVALDQSGDTLSSSMRVSHRIPPNSEFHIGALESCM